MSEDAKKHTMLKSVKMHLDCYNKTVTTFVSYYKKRVFFIYRLLSWGMKFNHQTIALTEEEQNVLAGAVYFKGTKILLA